MTLPILYVAGPMSGFLDYNWPAFRAASSQLRTLGFSVRCPTESGASFEMSWTDCMRLSLHMLLVSEAVALLQGWEGSSGAAIEVGLARNLKMAVHPLEYWLGHAASVLSVPSVGG
jgi:hypothetical protein